MLLLPLHFSNKIQFIFQNKTNQLVNNINLTLCYSESKQLHRLNYKYNFYIYLLFYFNIFFFKTIKNKTSIHIGGEACKFYTGVSFYQISNQHFFPPYFFVIEVRNNGCSEHYFICLFF